MLLAACASRPPLATGRAATAFDLEGRIALQRAGQRQSAAIAWRHRPDGDRIRVYTPLGQTVAELSRDSGGARLVLADGRSYSAADWQGLTETLFGDRLPLDALPAWLAGETDVAPAGWRTTGPDSFEFRHDDIEVRLKIDSWDPP